MGFNRRAKPVGLDYQGQNATLRTTGAEEVPEYIRNAKEKA
jgi:hypothetical protein